MKPKRFWTWIGIAALGTLALFRWADASGIVTSAYSLIENAGSALTKRQTLNFVNGGCVDNSGSQRTDCTIGASGGGALLSAVSLYVTSSGSPQYMPLSGASTWGVSGTKIMSSTESEVQQLSPATTTLSTLYALLATAPGSGNSIAITLRDNGTNTSVTCTIATAATTCSDLTDTASINPADALDYSIVISGSPVLTTTLAVSIGVGSVAVNANPAFTISNAASTGTTVNTLTKLTGAPSTAVITATTDTGGAVGITTAGAGTSGTATITTAGKLPCVFDGATTAGDYVQISSSTPGNCHDTGSASYPSSGGQVVGRTLSTNASNGTYTMDLFPSEIQPGGASGFTAAPPYLVSGGVSYVAATGYQATKPSGSGFSYINSVNPSIALAGTNGDYIYGGTGTTQYFQEQSCSTSIEAEFTSEANGASASAAGIWMWDSTNSFLYVWQTVGTGSSDGLGISLNKFSYSGTGSPSFNSQPFQFATQANSPLRHFKLAVSGGTMTVYLSIDGGGNFQTINTQSVGTISECGTSVVSPGVIDILSLKVN